MPITKTIRTLRKHSGFALAAALTLAVGVGLSTALLSGADALLLRPLPVPEPERIVRIYTAARFQPLGYFSYPDYADFARETRTLAGMEAQVQILAAMADIGGSRSGEAPRVRMGLAVTPNYFHTLRVNAQAGRVIEPADAHDAVVMLADSFWRSHYSRAESGSGVIGQTISIAGAPYTVIGVAPRGFGLDRFLREDFYVPMDAYAERLVADAGVLPEANGPRGPLNDRGRRFLSVFARLGPGAGVAQARAELAARAARLESEYPDTNRGRSSVVLTEREARWKLDRTVPRIAVILMLMAVLILAIACGNVSGLLLLRAEERAGEIALRSALGASPWRLLAGMQSECVPLAGAGLAAALPLAWALVHAAARSFTMPVDFAITFAPKIDGRMLAWATAAATGTTLTGGLVPWLAARRVNPADVLKSAGSKIAAAGRTRDALVVAHVALAAALLGACALMAAQMLAARRIDLGYRTDHVLAMAFDPAQLRDGESRARAFYTSLLESITQVPGVRRAALAQSVPLGMTGTQKQVRIGAALEPTAIWMNTVTPDYFELMRMPLREGRGFVLSDNAGSPAVAVVNEEMAKLWGAQSGVRQNAARQSQVRESPIGQGALGQVMTVAGRRIRIVGIVKDARYFAAGEAPRPFFYLPFAQNYASRMFLHVETAGAPAAMAPTAIALAHSIDARQPVSEVRALARYFDEGALFELRTAVRTAGTAAVCALLLALAGVYASLARTVQSSRKEIGIRLALGASCGDVTRRFAWRGTRLVTAGAAAGTALAAISATASASPNGLFGPEAGVSAVALGCSFAAVALAGMTASMVPARKAARLDPAVALRQD